MLTDSIPAGFVLLLPSSTFSGKEIDSRPGRGPVKPAGLRGTRIRGQGWLYGREGVRGDGGEDSSSKLGSSAWCNCARY